MRVVIRMHSMANMFINKEILGYVPYLKDPNRVCDHSFKLQIHFPHKYNVDKIKEIVSYLRVMLIGFRIFDQISVTTVRHKPFDNSDFRHISTKEVDGKSIEQIVYYAFTYIVTNIKTIGK